MGIGRIIGAAAPIAAGYFAPGSQFLTGAGGLGLSATGASIAAGALTGAGIAALSGQDALGGAVTGGLGGMTGGGLNTAIKGAQTAATTAEANKIITDAAMGQQAAAQAAYTGPQSMMTNSRIIGGEGFKAANLAGPGPGGYVSNYTPTSTSMMDTLKSNTIPQTPAAEFGKNYGISDVAREFGGGSEAMGYGKMGIAGLGVAGQAGAFDVEPVDIGPREEEKYDPTRRLNLGMDTGINEALKRDTGLRLLASGGEIKKYANGGYATILEAAQAMDRMHPDSTITRNGRTHYSNIGSALLALADRKGLNINPSTDTTYSNDYALNLNTGKQEPKELAQGGEIKKYADGGVLAPLLANIRNNATTAQFNPGGQFANPLQQAAVYEILRLSNNPMQNAPEFSGMGGGDTSSNDYALNLNTGKQELKQMASGGYMNGNGDGMSDNIKANIEGKQEARLSDGEFVIPADVVSHLGNGSSNAGAKQLYSMMDKIRQARTGNSKQGKEIKPERYMPR